MGRRYWTTAEQRRLLELCGSMTCEELANEFDRTQCAIKNRLRSLGAQCVSVRRSRWTKVQEQQLLTLRARGASLEELAALYGRTERAVASKLDKLRNGTDWKARREGRVEQASSARLASVLRSRGYTVTPPAKSQLPTSGAILL